MSMVTHYKFEVVKYTASVALKVDGKKRQRQKTFEQTINPFNKNDDGTLKTYTQIMSELRLEAGKWREKMKAEFDG